MLSAARRRTRRTPWMQLLSALLDLAQGQAELVRHAERTWASVTFSGTRHSVVLAFTGAEAVAVGEGLIDALPDHEFAIPGQLVADAAVVRVEHSLLPEPRLEVEIEVLMLDEV
ncbi:MAG: hypothetical protein WBL74_11780 [Novosphingobium sp.]|uniref:hypothetical protein n=1 Tax=Novosphingobium sp. TaxID=1874826 RepID=UPI003C79F20B